MYKLQSRRHNNNLKAYYGQYISGLTLDLLSCLTLHDYQHELFVWGNQDFIILGLQPEELQLVIVVEVSNCGFGLGCQLWNQPGNILT